MAQINFYSDDNIIIDDGNITVHKQCTNIYTQGVIQIVITNGKEYRISRDELGNQIVAVRNVQKQVISEIKPNNNYNYSDNNITLKNGKIIIHKPHEKWYIPDGSHLIVIENQEYKINADKYGNNFLTAKNVENK
jgi:hypothetical protein